LKRKIQALSEGLRATARFDLPVYNIAAMMFAAKKRTVKLDAQFLCDKTNVCIIMFYDV
jgi:hypothetical protein